ncbi:MAG TPA: four helix bundle protein [Bacteroidales bacterium]|nr:four helix bundle protein [Bacteroidales bacterium]
MPNYRGFRDLIVYKKSYDLAMDIFEITKIFLKEEKYSLVDQIRRSSRSVPANIAEAWIKRKYSKSFVSKLLDSLAEEAETEVWINMSKDSKYIDEQVHNSLLERYQEIAKMLNSMINTPEKFCTPT